MLQNNTKEELGWGWSGQNWWLSRLRDGVHHTFLIPGRCFKFSIIVNESIRSIIYHLMSIRNPAVLSRGRVAIPCCIKSELLCFLFLFLAFFPPSLLISSSLFFFLNFLIFWFSLFYSYSSLLLSTFLSPVGSISSPSPA